MRKVLAVLSFELRRRWMFLAGCFLLGVVALAAPALPFYHRWSAAEVRMAAAA